MKKTDFKRRAFLGASLVFGAGSIVWFKKLNKKVHLFSSEVQVLLHAAYHLYPSSELGPGSREVHIASYFAFVLEDERILREDKEYFLKGAFWLEESAHNEYEKSFININAQQKEALFKKVTQERWGENFVYICLGYVLEALLCPPVYGSNPDKVGWIWLEHNPGFPLPSLISDTHYDI